MSENSSDSNESVSLPSEEIARAYRTSLDGNECEVTLAEIHHRGGQTEFDLGRRYAQSADPLDRVTGADILAQLGWGEPTFNNEAVDLLLQLAADSDDRVVQSAFVGLGHRRSERGIPVILPRIHSPNSDIRLAAVHGLCGQKSPAALAGLIALSSDEDRDTRNWAAFALASGTDADTTELRDALFALLSDEDPEIRGEALVGLAERKDPRALSAIKHELNGPFYGSWCLDAAEVLGEQELLPLVLSLRERTADEDRETFADDFNRAIVALGGEPQL